MKTKHLIIEVPDDFKSDGRTRYACDSCVNKNGGDGCCPLGNAREAVEVKETKLGIVKVFKTEGPVTLYAVEVKK